MIAPLTPDYPLEYLRPEARMSAFLGIIAKFNELVEAINQSYCPCIPAGKNIDTCPVHGGTVKSSGFRPLHIEDGQVQEAMADNLQAQIDERKELWDYEVRENIIKQRHIVALSEEVVELEKDKETLMEWLRDSKESAKRLRTKVDAMERDLNILLVESGKTPIPSVPEAEPQEHEKKHGAWTALNEAINAYDREWFAFYQPRSTEEPPDSMKHARAAIFRVAHRESAQPDKQRCQHRRVRLGCIADGHTQPPQWQYVECVDCEDRMSLPAAQPGKGV